MIDHVSLRVTDLERSVELYKAALAPLGYKVQAEFPGVVGLGVPGGQMDFWITKTDKPINHVAHIGFGGTRAQVDAFYTAAISAGAMDNGAPGGREMYSPVYYGAFVLDYDGNNIEVCSHEDPLAQKAKRAVQTAKKAIQRLVGSGKKAAPKAAAKAGKKAAAKAGKKAAPKAGKKAAAKAAPKPAAKKPAAKKPAAKKPAAKKKR
jgi:catechol 2,3-dioxygenase-like lactoylglutathione lyase family enzyme